MAEIEELIKIQITSLIEVKFCKNLRNDLLPFILALDVHLLIWEAEALKPTIFMKPEASYCHGLTNELGLSDLISGHYFVLYMNISYGFSRSQSSA